MYIYTRTYRSICQSLEDVYLAALIGSPLLGANGLAAVPKRANVCRNVARLAMRENVRVGCTLC